MIEFIKKIIGKILPDCDECKHLITPYGEEHCGLNFPYERFRITRQYLFCRYFKMRKNEK